MHEPLCYMKMTTTFEPKQPASIPAQLVTSSMTTTFTPTLPASIPAQPIAFGELSDIDYQQSLFKFTLTQLATISFSRYLWLGYGFNMVLNLVKWWLYSQIGKGKTLDSPTYFYLTFWIIVSIGQSQVWNLVVCPIIIKTNKKIDQVIVERTYFDYSRFSQKYKNTCNIEKYRNRLNDATQAVNMLLDWGVPNFFSLINGIFSCVIVSYNSGFMILPACLFLINTVFYFGKIRSVQKEISSGRKERQKQKSNLTTKKTLRLPMFQYGELKVDHIFSLYSKSRELFYIDVFNWRTLEWLFNSINDFTLFILLAFPYFYEDFSIVNMLMIMTIVENINSSFRYFSQFLNKYDKFSTQFDTFKELLLNVEFEDKVSQNKIPKQLTITGININASNFNLKTSSAVEWYITLGNICLVTGPSGSGKSTFINGLIGNMPGVTFNHLAPQNYKSDVMYYYQTIRETTSTSDISIKELFVIDDDEPLCLDTLHFCCRLCCIDTWIQDRDVYEKINNEISGGQKSRLLIAAKLYQLQITGKNMLILDEPEQGSDPPVAYQMLKNISDHYTKTTMDPKQRPVTIVIISHLEKILDEAHTGIHFDHVFRVADGLITM